MRRLVAVFAVLWAASVCGAAVFRVEADGSGDYPTIQAAIDDSNYGDIIEIQPGVYCGLGNKNLDFGGKVVAVQGSNPYAPAIVAATIIDCENSGRGFYFHSGEDANSLVSGLTITRGSVSDGGGIYCNGSSPTISHCVITGNRVVNTNCNGGGIYLSSSNTAIKHCVITKNSMVGSNRWGGGVFCYGGNPTISHCTISGNSALKGGGVFSYSQGLRIANCILWGDSGGYGSPEINFSSNSYRPAVVYSDVQGGWSGEGNVNADPLFLDISAGDYHLSANSPCIDGGNPMYEFILGEVDIDGDPLLGQGRIDIGADEFCLETDYAALTSETVMFYAFEDSIAPEAQTVYLLKNVQGSFAWEVSGTCAWLDVNPPSGQIDGSSEAIVIRAYPGGLSRGAYSCELTITVQGASNSPLSLRVILHILNEGEYYVPSDFQTIQGAIDWAGEGEAVIVVPGVYTGMGNKNLDFGGKALTVRSIDPNDPNVTNMTVIDCEDWGRGFYFHSGEDANSVLSGFTIKNGYGRLGGGIFCQNSSPTIRNCIITGNAVSGNESRGGGLYLQESNAKVLNCTIIGNSIGGTNHYGGGVCCSGGEPTIQNCIIARNEMPISGGGIYGASVVSNCTIVDNSASHDGGGIYGPAIIRNSIVWGNTAHFNPEIGGYFYEDPKVTYSAIRGGRPGPGNMDAAPCLVNPEEGDFHVSHDSPCIDKGDPEYDGGPEGVDIDGDNRIINGRVDIGADEVSYVQPFIKVSSDKCLFFAFQGRANPENQVLSISNAGRGHLKWKITEDCAWLDVSRGSGTSESGSNEVTVRVDGNILAEGIYSSEILIDAKDAFNSPVRIPVVLCVYAPKDRELLVPFEYATIQSAIDGANDGDIVVLAPGIYRGDGNRDLDFLGKAITVRSVEPLNKIAVDSTVIDCRGKIEDPHRGFRFSNGEGHNSVLEGITIGNGVAPRDYCLEFLGRPTCWPAGGGIFCENSSPTIRHCVIRGSVVVGGNARGGGIFCANSSPKITHCTITYNWVQATSGGIRCDKGSHPFVANCVISNNRAFTHDSGGIGLYDSWLDIEHCTVVNNSPEGIYNYNPASGATISNSIFWGNAGTEISGPGFEVSYSSIEGGYPGIENTEQDPLFFGTSIYDYHLLPYSPCIDSGDPNYAWDGNEVDLDGRARVVKGLVDMGAYEFLMLGADVEILPEVLNRRAKGAKEVLAIVYLGEQCEVGQFNVGEGVKLYPGGVGSVRCAAVERLSGTYKGVSIAASFSRDEVLEAIAENGNMEIEIVGHLNTGEWFSGSEVLRIE